MPDLDRELFESAMSESEPEVQGNAPASEQEPEAQPATEGERARDDKGRFASKAEAEPKPEDKPEKPGAVEQAADQQQANSGKPENAIPSYRLKEEAEAKRAAISRAEAAEKQASELSQSFEALQRQFVQLQQRVSTPQQESQRVNLFDNPEQWEQQQQHSVQTLLQQQQFQFSEQLARIKYGDELYDSADKAAQKAMAMGQIDPELMSVPRASNPGVALVEWYRRKQNMERLGGQDIDKYIEQEIEKRSSDPQFLNKMLEKARAQAKPNSSSANQQINNPPSLNRQTSAAPNVLDDDDDSDAALLKSALKR